MKGEKMQNRKGSYATQKKGKRKRNGLSVGVLGVLVIWYVLSLSRRQHHDTTASVVLSHGRGPSFESVGDGQVGIESESNSCCRTLGLLLLLLKLLLKLLLLL
jgi:hypothetical protein